MNTEKLITEANTFISTMYNELQYSQAHLEERLASVSENIIRTGSYFHTEEELQYGAKVAWRNNSRCIGRLFWKSLIIADCRHLSNADQIFDALLHHIERATNNGRIQPLITVFSQSNAKFTVNILNHQLVRYAGYQQEKNTVGDPDSVAFTALCMKLGWRGAGTAYDVLPLVIQINNEPPCYRNIPEQIIKEVQIEHPSYSAFRELQLQWYAVPIVSDMELEIGGIRYTAAPFNGWYMGTEIATRNFGDEYRYNMLPAVAKSMGLDISSNVTMWKDRALVELNEAVIYSYKKNKVSIVDHHTASEQFRLFCEQENQQQREVNARWSWLIPPMSPTTSVIWHTKYNETDINPNYYRGAQCPFHKIE